MESTLKQRKTNSEHQWQAWCNDNSKKAVRGEKTTPKSRLRCLFKAHPAAEASQFFYHSALKFTSIVLQVDSAK